MQNYQLHTNLFWRCLLCDHSIQKVIHVLHREKKRNKFVKQILECISLRKERTFTKLSLKFLCLSFCMDTVNKGNRNY